MKHARRRLLEERIAHDREVFELRIVHLAEVGNLHRDSTDKALTVATTELLRRLDILNGERELERSRSAEFATRESVAIEHRAILERLEQGFARADERHTAFSKEVTERFERDEAGQNRWSGGLGAIIGAVGLIVGVLAIVGAITGLIHG